MGRRKIEIKAIKDDRNRSVTFLKRKGGLFKKAHELSVLCSVDVAVFIFGNNKKLYEYSSADMHELIGRYQYHGGANEHKGPGDFNGGNDDDDDEDGDITPPRAHDSVEPHMMPPQYHGQQHAPYPQIRNHTPSASPPIANGVPFQPHHGHHVQRGHTPQPPVASRPGSRNDGRRMGPGSGMVSQPAGPQGAHPGITYMPTPPIYNPPQQNQSNLMPQPNSQYSYQAPQQQQYVDSRLPPPPPGYTSQPPPQSVHAPAHADASPQPNQQQPPHGIHISPPSQHERRFQDPPPPPPVEPKTEPTDSLHPSTDPAIKKLPQRKSHSIFTPIDEGGSILSRHLASFESEPPAPKTDPGAAPPAANRAQTVDTAAASRNGTTASPPAPQRSATQGSIDSRARTVSVSSSAADGGFLPPSRSDSFKLAGPGGARPRGPQLTLQIPDGGSEPGSATAESNSPRNPVEASSQPPPRHNSHSSVVLPPPSPSATALLSAGATGPPNPFARPPPQQSVNGDTPVSALPSRFMNNELLPSPSSFYPEWNFRGSDSNTLPSPLNFATPVTGPSFLKDDHSSTAATTAGSTAPTTTTTTTSMSVPASTKRKTPDYEPAGHDPTSDPKRLRVE